MEEDDSTIPIMQITDEGGNVYWMQGHEYQDAVDSFGSEITVELFNAVAAQQTKET